MMLKHMNQKAAIDEWNTRQPAMPALPEGYVAMPGWFADQAMAAYNAATPDLSSLHPSGGGAQPAELVKVPSDDEIMTKVQEFASTWATAGGRFDDGTAMERAEACKAEIRALLARYGNRPEIDTSAERVDGVGMDQPAARTMTSADVERQYRDGVHIGSGLPRETCPCGLCSKYRQPAASAEPVRAAADALMTAYRAKYVRRTGFIKLNAPLLDEFKALATALHANPVAAQPQPSGNALPERDITKPAEQQGLFRKFDVRRTDGSDAPGGKHHGCRYFVLDVDRDQHAAAALTAYAAACQVTHPALAADLREKWGAAQPSGKAGELHDAVRFACDVLAEIYAKYQVKIGPFASQAQLANTRLRAALATQNSAIKSTSGDGV